MDTLTTPIFCMGVVSPLPRIYAFAVVYYLCCHTVSSNSKHNTFRDGGSRNFLAIVEESEGILIRSWIVKLSYILCIVCYYRNCHLNE